MARSRYSGLFNNRQNGRFVSYSRRRTFKFSLKNGFMSKKDYSFLYKHYKGKGF